MPGSGAWITAKYAHGEMFHGKAFVGCHGALKLARDFLFTKKGLIKGVSAAAATPSAAATAKSLV